MGIGLPIGNWGPLTRALAGTLALALVGTAAWVGYALFGTDRDTPCGPELMYERGPFGECVGLSDGEEPFHESLGEVSGAIWEENQRVVAEREESDARVVTVAFVLPMTSEDPIERDHAVREVQGAYLAQYRANNLSNDRRPLIRLVLANPGRDSAQWRHLTEPLAELRTHPDHPLRAVAGFNVSTPNTKDALSHFTNELGLPTVVGPLTAEDIGNSAEREDAFPGLVKVVPNNDDQVAALAHHFAGAFAPEQTLLVEDVREQGAEEGGEDNFVASLRRAFGELTEESPYRPAQYRSPEDVNDVGTLSGHFGQMVQNICLLEDVDVIYFAGRNVQQRQFVNALGERRCDREFQVVTVSGASTLASDAELELAEGITVTYTAGAHPDAWTGPDVPGTGGSADDFDQLSRTVGEVLDAGYLSEGAVSLEDSRTIVMHDAVWTAVTGIHKAAAGGADDGAGPRAAESGVPDLAEVTDAWLRLRQANRVYGASGWICLDNHGHPDNKAVAIVSLVPGREEIRFDGLSWPDGAPPTADC